MRRVSLVIAFVGLNLMACCCGGVAPPAKNPNAPQVMAEDKKNGEPGGKKKITAEGPGKKQPAGGANAVVAAYNQFPEPHKSDLIADWKGEVEATRRAIEDDKTARKRAKTSAERERFDKRISVFQSRLARLQINDPPYVTNPAAERVAKYREETADKEIAAARENRKGDAEAEANAKNAANRIAHEAELAKAKAVYANQLEDYDTKKSNYDTLTAEYEGTRELNLARTFDSGKTKDVANRRFREVISKYPGTQAAKDAKVLLDDGFVEARKPVSPTPPVKPQMVRPRGPDQVKVIYPPDPVSQAATDAARKTEAAYAPEIAALTAADAEVARRAAEEYEIDGLVLLQKTLKGVRGDFSGEITGTVVNQRDRTLSYVQITFNLYDETGALVGTALANVNNLEAGGRWNFRAVTLSNRWTTYKCTGLKGL